MLCRILTELKLLSTPVGIIVLSAGVSNDVVGWILLALCVALVNAGSGLTALYVLLAVVAYGLLLIFAVRPAFLWVLRRTSAIQEGPSQGVIVLTLLIALASAFFTGVVGVHPIFGAFMAGLICPHEGGFAIKVAQKIEDLISALFLPLYFAFSGLSTNLGLLNSGITWAYVVGVIAVAFCAKFAGGTLAARLNGLVWRESFTIGVLMSCKGLVELIVLNIGLQAKILSTRTFTIFVVMALVTTFATTPLTVLLYPPQYQRKLEAWKRGEIDWDTGRPICEHDDPSDALALEKLQARKVQSILVYLRLDGMPTLLDLVSLLGDRPAGSRQRKHPSNESEIEQNDPSIPSYPLDKRPVQVHCVRLLELTERGSSVMQVSEVDELTLLDPVLNAFKVLGQVYNLAISGEATVTPVNSYADVLVGKAADESSDLLLLPWTETGSMSEAQIISRSSADNMFAAGDGYAGFVAAALDRVTCAVAVFINNGFSGTLRPRPSALDRSVSGLGVRRLAAGDSRTWGIDRGHHVFVPFFGGADGRAALRLALQLAEDTEVTATVVHYQSQVPIGSASKTVGDVAFVTMLQRSLQARQAERVVFETVEVNSESLAAMVDAAVEKVQGELARKPRNSGDLIVVGRSLSTSERAGTATTSSSLAAVACLGVPAQKFLESNTRASVLIVQAAK